MATRGLLGKGGMLSADTFARPREFATILPLGEVKRRRSLTGRSQLRGKAGPVNPKRLTGCNAPIAWRCRQRIRKDTSGEFALITARVSPDRETRERAEV